MPKKLGPSWRILTARPHSEFTAYQSTWHHVFTLKLTVAILVTLHVHFPALMQLTTWPIRIAVVICQYDVTSAAPALLLLTHSSEVTPGAPSTVVALPSLWIGPARCHDDRRLQPPWGHTGYEGQFVGVTVHSAGPCPRTRGQFENGDTQVLAAAGARGA